MLHIKVEERTRELEEQKKLLSTQASELYRQNQLLKQQNEKITKQKGQLIQMSKKVQELTVDKLAFFTNITHEFPYSVDINRRTYRKGIETKLQSSSH